MEDWHTSLLCLVYSLIKSSQVLKLQQSMPLEKSSPPPPPLAAFFHLSQCVIWKIASVSLKGRYENDSGFSVFMKCLSALAFVPEDGVILVFEELALILPQKPEVKVVAYFETTYIRGMQTSGCQWDPRFPVKLWNHFDDAEESAPKTTNCCEGFHNALKSVYMCAHPTMWKFWRASLSTSLSRNTIQKYKPADVILCSALQWPPIYMTCILATARK